MIVRLAADGVVVQDADDCTQLHVSTDLDAAGVRTALTGTGTGEAVDADTVLLDLAVLRSRAQLVATAPDWAQRWETMTSDVERTGRLSPDRRSVRVRVEREPGSAG
jgi:hypothetical protein